MNAKKLIAAFAVFAAAGSASADQIFPFVEVTNFQSTKTRAEVIAEMQQAKEDGSYALARQEYQQQLPATNEEANARTRVAGKNQAGKLN